MQRLKRNFDGFDLYCAGLPRHQKNFTRDSLVASFILKDPEMLKNQLKFCAYKQGTKKNPKTGEEPGKIFHEYPPFKIFKYTTEYNTCDSNALFLIGHEKYYQWTKDKSLIKSQKSNIEKAAANILKHLNKDNLFMESPMFCNGKRFLLLTTYWKDTGIIHRFLRTPKYPVVFSLAHIQNMAGLRSAAKILNSKILKQKAEKMKEALKKLWDKSLGVFHIAIDKKGPISGISSDFLHSLFYLEKKDITKKMLKSIEKASKRLETIVGYRSLSHENGGMVSYWWSDYIHMVWPFEQALIHMAAKKFSLKRLEKVSTRVVKFLKNAPEIFLVFKGKVTDLGCNPQLWTLAAKYYFKEQRIY